MSFAGAKERQIEFKHIADAVENVRFRTGKPIRRDFRASSFPYCPVLDLVGFLESHLDSDNSVAYAQEFYFNMGRTVNDLWQTAMVNSPKYGDSVYGSWVCPDSGETIKNQLKPKRGPKSGGTWAYKELEYRYRGLNGHSDLVTMVDAKNYTLWELKTVPYWFLQSPRLCSDYPMFNKSRTQARIYAFMLRKMLRIPVTKIVIVNLSRENPRLDLIKLAPLAFTDDDYRRTQRMIDRAVDARKTVTRLLGHRKRSKPPKSELTAVLDARPCHKRRDYYSKMDERFYGKSKCPIYSMGLCTKDSSGRKLPAFVKELWREALG